MQKTNQLNIEKLNYFLDYFDKNQKGFNKLLHMVQIDDVVPNVQNLIRSMHQLHSDFTYQVNQGIQEIKKIRNDTKIENDEVIYKVAQRVGDTITKKVVNRTDKIVRGKVIFYNRKSNIAGRYYKIAT